MNRAMMMLRKPKKKMEEILSKIAVVVQVIRVVTVVVLHDSSIPLIFKTKNLLKTKFTATISMVKYLFVITDWVPALCILKTLETIFPIK